MSKAFKGKYTNHSLLGQEKTDEASSRKTKHLGRKRLRKEIHGRIRVLKRFQIYQGLYRAIHMPRARRMLRKDPKLSPLTDL